MDVLQGLLLILIGLGAAFVQRVSGFGLGIFVMTFLPHFMPSHTAAATISTILSCFATCYNAFRFRKKVNFKIALPMIVAAMVTVPVAVHFSAVVSAEIFSILLGVVLILLSLYFLFFSRRIRIRPKVGGGILAGALGGTLNGLFSTGGPPVVLYLSCAVKEPLCYFATIQFYFCITNVYSLSVRFLNGLVTGQVLLYAAIGVIGCLLGDALGKKVFDRLNADSLKKIIYVGMILSGLTMLIP